MLDFLEIECRQVGIDLVIGEEGIVGQDTQHFVVVLDGRNEINCIS